MSGDDPGPWRWVQRSVVLAIHDRQLAEHGGSDGIRDPGAIESALARPVNLANYGDHDIAELAESCAGRARSTRCGATSESKNSWVWQPSKHGKR